jgi:hypothetical protein
LQGKIYVPGESKLTDGLYAMIRTKFIGQTQEQNWNSGLVYNWMEMLLKITIIDWLKRRVINTEPRDAKTYAVSGEPSFIKLHTERKVKDIAKLKFLN